MTKLEEAFLKSEEASKALGEMVKEHFMSLSLPEKVYWALTKPIGFLDHDRYYTNRVDLPNGEEVSFYDDLHWERYETYTVDQLLQGATEDWEGWDQERSDEDNLALFAAEAATLDIASCAVALNMLSNGLKSGRNDW